MPLPLEQPRQDWHTHPVESVLELLHTTTDGLSTAEAQKRQRLYGPNELEAVESPSPMAILAAQFKNVLIGILLAATAAAAALGHGVEAIAISVIVLFAVILGFAQEYRAERAIEALRRMAAPTALVLRDGKEVRLPAREIVPGDVVLLHTGDRVPADVRLLEAMALQTDEAALTGESLPTEKHILPLVERDVPLGDRQNMAYAGTVVTSGRGRGVVVATGMQTEFGRIAGMLRTIETGRTPLQRNLDRVGRALARAALVIVALIVVLGLLRDQPFLEMLLFGIALAVAVVPEALPAVVTISLALGVQRMARRNALVRRLPAVETLGSTSFICSDKTGTLTRNEMTVRRMVAGDEIWEISGTGYEPQGHFLRNGVPEPPSEVLLLCLQTAVLASDARLLQEPSGRWHVQGDPTEGALLVAAAKAGLSRDTLEQRYRRVAEISFASERRRMTTLHEDAASLLACSKGAPETVLDSCEFRLTRHGREHLDRATRAALLRAAEELGGEGLRVLAVAYKQPATVEDAERGMTFLGLVAMIDPPRPEARAAIQRCRDAGIGVAMITGDHPATARAVALDLGLLAKGRLVTGAELDAMSQQDLEREVERIEVYSRVSPTHKLRVVTALQAKGHVVAMTGDGVNDAPALKKADIGVAMGITGTDVSKEAAAMTLLDDNFATIVAAVEEGRTIFANIKKYLLYLLSSNIGEIGLVAAATLLGMPLPLTAVQILYVNLATDGLPAIALALDVAESDIMRQPPRNPRSGIFTRPVVTLMLVAGGWSALVNLLVLTSSLSDGRTVSEAMALTFVSLTLIQLFKAYNFRSDRHSIAKRPFANRWLDLAVSWELLLLLAIVYIPPLQRPFATFALGPNDWFLVLGAAVTVIPVLEAAKWLARRGWLGGMV
jgi:Ca2+-transporting ATPase